MKNSQARGRKHETCSKVSCLEKNSLFSRYSAIVHKIAPKIKFLSFRERHANSVFGVTVLFMHAWMTLKAHELCCIDKKYSTNLCIWFGSYEDRPFQQRQSLAVKNTAQRIRNQLIEFGSFEARRLTRALIPWDGQREFVSYCLFFNRNFLHNCELKVFFPAVSHQERIKQCRLDGDTNGR